MTKRILLLNSLTELEVLCYWLQKCSASLTGARRRLDIQFRVYGPLHDNPGEGLHQTWSSATPEIFPE